MFTIYTFQDWGKASPAERVELLPAIVAAYKGSEDFQTGLAAGEYFKGDNRAVLQKTVLKAEATVRKDPVTGKRTRQMIDKDVVGNRVPTSFFFRFVTQQNNHLLSNGVTLDDDAQKALLGLGFDKTLEEMGEKALQHGVCWGFWNKDHIEAIPAVVDALSGAVALLDEMSGKPRVLVQFWQIDSDKPQYIRVFEQDGLTVFVQGDDGLEVYQPKVPYIRMIAKDGAGAFPIDAKNYDALPIIPLYANSEKRSEFTKGIKAKIDMYDNILSDFGDNLERANDVYWVLNNFGGTETDIVEMVQQMQRLKIVSNISDGTGQSSTAEPRTMEVPYQARQTALDLLKRALYQDYMALDFDEIAGRSMTNVAIKAAMTNLNLKCDRFEWQVFQFVQQVLQLVGIKTENIRFHRTSFVNEQETIQAIYAMRQDIDHETALKLNPMIMQEEIPQILANHAAEQVSGLDSMETLQAQIDSEKAE